MNRLLTSLFSVIVSATLGFGIIPTQAETGSPTSVWSFAREQPGKLPDKLSIGTLYDGRTAGEWQVLATERAKSPPHVLAQLMAKGAEHAYKVILLKDVIASDLNLVVSFLPIQGKADMAGSRRSQLLSGKGQPFRTKHSRLSGRERHSAPVTELQPDD